MRKICRNKPARIGIIILFATAAIVVFGLIVMLLWNALLPALLKLPVIGFWQAVGLLILARILFGHHGGPGRGAGRWQWKQHRFFEKWEKMTPEEREKLREQWATRCGRHFQNGARDQGQKQTPETGTEAY